MSRDQHGDLRQQDDRQRLARGVGGFISAQVDGSDRSATLAARSFAQVEANLQRGRQRRSTRRIAFAVVGCALVAGAGGFWARPRFADGPPEALTYSFGGGPALRVGSAPVPVAAATEPVLSFSDGTRVEMAPKAHGRVVALGGRGGRIALDDGRAHVQVVHRPGAEWLFEAGPFLISVHGTAFSFAWNAVDARFEVHMESGVVSVTGPVSGGEIVLRSGETLSVGLHDREEGGAAAVAAPDKPAAERQPPGERPAAAASSAEPPPRAAPKARASESWVTELAEGHAGAIVADAQRRGLDKVLADTGSEDLAALADAARYERNDALARRALQAQRRRFPRSVRAAEASFLLGRLEDESADGADRALGWYDRYLGEAPGGAYVSEALGRKMMALERTHRRTEAAAIAADYLGRFPTGTYAHAAEALVRAP